MNDLTKTIRRHARLSVAALIILIALDVHGQKNGSLRGKITDQLGAVVVASEVAVTDRTGNTLKTSTDQEGNYFFKTLAPGIYKLRVTSSDFAAFEAREVLVSADRAQAFDIQLTIKQLIETVAIESGSTLDSAPQNNFAETILRDKEILDLPEDPDALAFALKAMAPLGPGDPQIFIDGYTADTPPPKQSIREIRISQNNFSAEDDRPGGSRIQIFTKSGTNRLQGSAFFNWSDETLNARNPFAGERAPYAYRQYGFSLSGTLIPKRGSFYMGFQKLDENQNGIVSARVLDDSLNIVPLNRSIVIPRRNFYFNPRFDFQLSTNHQLTLRYGLSDVSIENLGVGELSLPARGYRSNYRQHVLQVTETAVLNAQTVNETRFQFIRNERALADDNASPGIVVQGAFSAGGAGIGNDRHEENIFELQNYTTTNTKFHLLRFGIKLRSIELSKRSPGNFNGTYTFAGGAAPLLDAGYRIVLDQTGEPVQTQITSLERYRRTLLLQREGFGPAAIRNRGGGAAQFSIALGEPEAEAEQLSFGAFFQDEWRLKPNLNLYLGIRYEGQTNIDDRSNFAPRLAFAWVPKIGKNENTTVRGGFGWYYDRFNETYTLQSRLYDGFRQQRIISSDPALIDRFPEIPPAPVLASFFGRQTVTKIAGDIKAARSFVSLINFEHKLFSKTSFYAGLSIYRTWHGVRIRNINAPLPGTYVFGEPASGIRPFGNSGEIFLIESSNGFFQNQFYAGFRSQINRFVYLAANYLLSDTKDGGTAGGYTADSYNTRSEWGRSGAFSIRHRSYLNARLEIPKIKVALSPQLIAFSQRPFDIITGLDTNGDQIFAERPSFSTYRDGANIYRTPFGTFNATPLEGEIIIPRNIGRGPAFFSVNLGISRTFGLGAINKTGNSKNKSSERPYKLTLAAQIQNLFNRVNLATPIGNLSSPLFGQSVKTAGAYGFEDGSPSFNRRIEVQIAFSF